jgi:hypothetical protein
MSAPEAYVPDDELVSLVVCPVALFLMVMAALGTTAPLGSVTVPWMLPVATVDCAPADSRLKVVKLIHRIKANQNFGLLILFLLRCYGPIRAGRG